MEVQIVPFDLDRHLTDTYVGWLNDPTVVRWSEQRHRAHTLDSCREWVSSFNDSSNRLWAIEVDGRHVGNIAAYVDLANSLANLTIMIGEPDLHGHGIGSRAWQQGLQAIQESGIRKIGAGTLALNKPMRRIFAKCGMVEDGVRRDHFLVDGEPVDVVYAAKFAH